jgi:ATP-binding cassette, subfamily B, bacterial PglK
MTTDSSIISSTNEVLSSLWKHISERRRLQLLTLLIVMLASGLAELISLGSLIPFLSALSNPRLMWNQPFIRDISLYLGFNSPYELIIPTSILFSFAAIISSGVRIANLSLNGRIAAAIGSDLSCESYRRTLYQSYNAHLKSNSSELIAGITTLVARTVATISALLQILSSSIVVVFLVIGMLFVKWNLALFSILFFGGIYSFIVLSVRKELRRNSRIVAIAAGQQVKALQEGLGGIRDVLMSGSQQTYLNIYRDVDRPQRRLQARNSFLGSFPRYAIESSAMVLFAFVGALLATNKSSSAEVIPLLGTFALGSQRLLPALQQVYNGWSIVKRYTEDVAKVVSLLDKKVPIIVEPCESIQFNNSIFFDAISFRYSKSGPYVITNFSFKVRKGERIGIVGPTGSGKSTIIDILIGLQPATSGGIFVDGIDIYSSPSLASSWRSSVGYVPQSIYLGDCSLAENIAFGVPCDQIDFDKINEVIKTANLGDVIAGKANGFMTLIGERGVLLSGGQRQRIGIARALYKCSKMLVLDEATSALDINTEKKIMNEINHMASGLTIFMIAHRLETLKSCDRIIKIENGSIAEEFGPDQL